MGIVAKYTVNEVSRQEMGEIFRDMMGTLSTTEQYKIYVLDSKKLRKLSKLRYYWGVLLKQVEEQTGQFKEEVHEINKELFGIKKTILFKTAEGIAALERVYGLSKMNDEIAADFIKKAMVYWGEQGVVFYQYGEVPPDAYLEALHYEKYD